MFPSLKIEERVKALPICDQFLLSESGVMYGKVYKHGIFEF